MKLSVVIPCYNEHGTIENIIAEVRKSPFNKEIIVVDDGSTDGTRPLLAEKFVDADDIKVIFQPFNQGKGAALKAGFQQATGDIVLVQDADLEYSPSDYPVLLWPIVTGKADVVYGSRFQGGPGRVLYFYHTLGNKFLTLLSNLLTDLNLTDMETCYKVFRRPVIQSLKLTANRFGIEPEITAKIAKVPGLRIYEVPVQYHGRTYAEGKKITWKDGAAAFWYILKFNLLDNARSSLTMGTEELVALLRDEPVPVSEEESRLVHPVRRFESA